MKRDISIDLLRTISIFLIVLGHTYVGNNYYDWFYIQVFFFVSGMFYKYDLDINKAIIRIFRNLFIPFFTFALFCSIFCLVLNRVSIYEVHLYDPDSYDNGPLWFLITLMVLELSISIIEQIKSKLLKFPLYFIIFSVSYYCACNGYDDYSDWVKAGVSLPFFVLGRIYMKYKNAFLRYKYFLWIVSLSVCAWVVSHGTSMCFRILDIPHNVIEYLLYPMSGLFLLFITIQILLPLSLKTKYMDCFAITGKKSLFVLCLHWPILQVLRSMFNLDGNIWGILTTVALCTICTIAGIYLTKWFPSIFNPNARKN